MDYGEVVIGENCVRQKLEEEEAEFRMTGTMNQATDTSSPLHVSPNWIPLIILQLVLWRCTSNKRGSRGSERSSHLAKVTQPQVADLEHKLRPLWPYIPVLRRTSIMTWQDSPHISGYGSGRFFLFVLFLMENDLFSPFGRTTWRACLASIF